MQATSQNVPPSRHSHPARQKGRSGVIRAIPATLVFLASVAGLSMLAWFASGFLAKEHEVKLLERERIMASTTAETISANLGRNLAQLHSIPMVLASEPSLVRTLSRFGPDIQPSALPQEIRRKIWQADPDFMALTQRFQNLIHQADVSQVWITNAAADCFVSAGFPEEVTATGVNYVKRHYFQEAKQGRNSSQFAVGATTNIPGLFFSSPIKADGHFLGVVVVKIELPKLAPLVATANTFITDENGAIILTKDPELFLQTVPGATVTQLPADALDNRYRRQSFKPVDLKLATGNEAAGLVYWQGSHYPHVMVNKNLPGEGLQIHVLRSLDQLAQIHRDRLGLFFLLSLTGFLLISLAAAAIAYLRRSKEVRTKLTALANTDTLTGCGNRRSFLTALEFGWKCAVRYGTTFSVISLDLDHFKQINDRFGHSGGDQVLCHLVGIASKALRPCDKFGRVGGEEFAILLPQTPQAGAMAVAERILAEVRKSPVQIGAQQCSYTFSAGTAEWREGEKSSDDILHRADLALYQAKDAGRNRVQGGT